MRDTVIKIYHYVEVIKNRGRDLNINGNLGDELLEDFQRELIKLTLSSMRMEDLCLRCLQKCPCNQLEHSAETDHGYLQQNNEQPNYPVSNSSQQAPGEYQSFAQETNYNYINSTNNEHLNYLTNYSYQQKSVVDQTLHLFDFGSFRDDPPLHSTPHNKNDSNQEFDTNGGQESSTAYQGTKALPSEVPKRESSNTSEHLGCYGRLKFLRKNMKVAPTGHPEKNPDKGKGKGKAAWNNEKKAAINVEHPISPERQNNCSHLECNQSFERASDLKRHENSHENLRGYLCSICNGGFNRSDTRNNHKKVCRNKQARKARKKNRILSVF
ncbi:hypothetical protein CLU79DRAFT_492658 [Phycomyces nitens]|nr:hypothetical protein CLU79DRAFT_492658 [Phycomyces nitens]